MTASTVVTITVPAERRCVVLTHTSRSNRSPRKPDAVPTFFVLTMALVMLSSCGAGAEGGAGRAAAGQEGTAPEQTEGARESMTALIKSRDFGEGETLAKEFTCDGADRPPALSWQGVPDGTVSLALIMDDPDAPRGTFTHWLVWNLPPDTVGLGTTSAANAAAEKGGATTMPSEARQGKNGFGVTGYRGPCPPPGKPHRYRFHLYALDTKLDLPAGSDRRALDTALAGHVLGEAVLTGLYGR